MYTIEGLKEGIVHAKKNILVLEGAIQKEEEVIKEHESMIKVLEEKKENDKQD